MRDLNDLQEFCVLCCVFSIPILLFLFFLCLFFSTCINSGFPVDFWGWAYSIGLIVAIPIGYFITGIFPLIFGCLGLFMAHIIGEKNEPNRFWTFVLCLIASAVVALVIFLLCEKFFSGEVDMDEPARMHIE